MASSSLDEGASTGDGQLMERGAAPAACLVWDSGGCALPVSAASSGEDDGPNAPGSLDQVCPPPLRAVATGWLKGGASGRRAKAERPGEDGYGQSAPCPTPFPVPEARRSGLKNAAAGASDGASQHVNVSGAIPAPATPFA